MNMRQNDIDNIFNTVNNVTGAARDVANVFNDRFNDERCMDGSRRNNIGPQQPYTHVPYGYGYSDNYNNGFFQMNNSGGGGNIMQGYPGFYNSAYGGGMY